MSGGSLDYGFRRLDDLADEIDLRCNDPLHRAFAKHLRLCSTAAHALEWALSGDTELGSEVAAIRAVVSPSDVLNLLIEDGRQLEAELAKALRAAECGW